MFKKIFITLLIIILITLGALGIRYYFFGTPISTPTSDTPITDRVFDFLGIGQEQPLPENIQQEEFPEQEVVVPLTTLRELSSTPVAGATFIGTSTVRFVDRGTGHIFEASTQDSTVTKIVNTTIPKIYKAFWTNNGSGVLYQRLTNTNTKETVFIDILDTTGTSTEQIRSTETTYLPNNIDSLTISPNTDKIAYTIPTLPDASVTISDPNGGNSSSFSIQYPDWNISWGEELILTSKTTSNTNSLLYSATTNGKLSKELFEKGLTAISSPLSPTLLYTYTKNNTLFFEALHIAKNDISVLSPATLPEKCTFQNETTVICGTPTSLPNASYPEDWYQGVISFTDEVREYNLDTLESRSLYTPEEEMDIINPILSQDGNHLLFMNKKDLSLWILNLEEVRNQETITTF